MSRVGLNGMLLVILVVACATLAASQEVEVPGAVNSTVLHNFSEGSDGCCPFAGLARDREGSLYGVTEGGGATDYGTLFKLTPSLEGYSFRVLADFSESRGAFCEDTPVVDELGNVFGVCREGGLSTGTLWEYSSSGKFVVLRQFTTPDGQDPYDVALDRSGNLYGAAFYGPGGAGTLWRYSRSSQTFTVLHSFTGGADGADPSGPTIDSKGVLWGQTFYGPNCATCGPGTVWNYDPQSETFTTVLDFTSTGISNPETDFTIDKHGNLFGTAWPVDHSNWGTVYELQADNNYAPLVLYTFTNEQDGNEPFGKLRFDKHGNLIGTTQYGGAYDNGTVYEVFYKDGTWQETLLHSFEFWVDGEFPSGLITDGDCDRWFGTAETGGHGWGTAFELSGIP
jgi:uncharacterized repeat protein (TIGR03803 family)